MFELALIAVIGLGIYFSTKKDDEKHGTGANEMDPDKYMEITPSYVLDDKGYQVLRDDKANIVGQKIQKAGYRVDDADMSPSGAAVVISAVTPGDATMSELDKRLGELRDTVGEGDKAVVIMQISDVVSIVEKGIMPEMMAMYVAAPSKAKELAPIDSRFVQVFLVQK